MQQIKIRNKIIEIKPGDYILDNGASKQFIAGDMRYITGKGFDLYSSIVLTKKVCKEIDFAAMKQEIKNDCTYYYF